MNNIEVNVLDINSDLNNYILCICLSALTSLIPLI